MDEGGHQLRVERGFAVPPAATFDGFIDLYGDSRPDWIVRSEVDLRVGGIWSVVFEPPGVERFEERRRITALDPPHTLAYTVEIVRPDPTDSFTTGVTLSIAAEGAGSRVTLIQTGFPDSASREDFAGAWPQVLDLIATRLG